MPALDMDIAGLLKRINQAKGNQSSWMPDGDENSGYIGGYRLPGEQMYFAGATPGYGTYKADGVNVFDDGQGLYAYKDTDGSGIDYNNAPRDRYDYSGKYLGSDNWTDIGDADDTARMVAGAGMAAFGGLGAFGGGMFGSGSFGSAFGSGAGAAAGAGAGAAEGAGGFALEGLASGVPELGSAMSATAGYTPTAWTAAGAPVFGTVDTALTGSLLHPGFASAAGGAVGGAAGSAAGSAVPGVLNGPPVAPGMGAPAAGGLGGVGSALGGGGGAAGGLGGLLGGNGMGALATVAGALLGSQGENASTSQTRDLPEWLKGPAQTLVGQAQGMVGNQMQAATDQGASMIGKGASLMGAPVAGNGVGQVQLNAPNTPTNPYLMSMADDLSRRTQQLLSQNNNQIAGRQVAAGGMGSTRMGVAQGTAAGQAADSLQGQLAGLYGNAYNQDQNRALSQYGLDQSFWGNQRGQDLAQVGVGSGLINQGFQTQFSPLQNASQIYSPFTGNGTTTQSQQQGGGVTGALGGAIGAAQLGKNMGWW